MLKQFSESNTLDRDLLEPFDQQLLHFGLRILKARKAFMNDYLPFFLSHYQNLSEGREKVEIRHESNLEVEHPAAELSRNLRRDLALQRSNVGIHKDDYVFEIEDRKSVV